MISMQHMDLLSTIRLGASIGGGEGVAMHVGANGKRTLFVASERAPGDFAAVDVTDPRNPSIVYRRDLPGVGIRSNNLSIVDDLLAVTRQVSEPGAAPAGVEFFDISTPSEPRSVGFFDASGGRSLGTHFVWLAGDGYAYLASGAPDYLPRDPRDHFVLQIIDIANIKRAVEVGRWWLPGLSDGDAEDPPERPADRLATAYGRTITEAERAQRQFTIDRVSSWDFGFRVHNISVLPEQPDRAYVAVTSGGGFVLDISDRSEPSVISHVDYAVPLPCAAHSFVPLGASGFGLLSDETLEDGAADFPQNVWVTDLRVPSRAAIVGSLELPWPDEVPTVGRFGAHNLHEYPTGQGALRSFDLAVAALFGLGVVVYDVSDPYRPNAVAHFSYDPDEDGQCKGQINDVFVDDRGVLYAVDRHSDHCFALELQL